MQIHVKTLRHALELLNPVVPRKASLPALTYVLVGENRAMANNLEVAVAIEVPEFGPERICLPTALVLDFLKMVPGEVLATLRIEKDAVVIEAGAQRGKFKTVDPEEFPPFPSIEPEHEAVVEGDTFFRHLRALAPYATREDSRPVLTAVCLELGDTPRMVVGDGFRLAWEELPGKLPGEGNILIPAAHARLLDHFWNKVRGGLGTPGGELVSLALVQRFIRLGWTTKFLRLNWGDVTLFMSLIEGTFPNWPILVPKAEDLQSHVTFLAEDLDRALRGMAPMAREASGIIRLEWDDGHLNISARSPETGDMKMRIAAALEGAGRIAFNCRYLLDYLKGKQGMVKLSISTPSAPSLLTYHGKGNVVLMPMFVQWAGEPAPAPPEPQAEATESEAPSAQVDTPQEEGPPPEEEGEENVMPAAKARRRGRKAKAA